MVVDASFALRLLLPNGDEGVAHAHWDRWIREGTPRLAPNLWASEVTSALRRLEAAGELTEAETGRLLEQAFGLGVELLPLDLALCQSALGWAAKLGQAKAYDGTYLALAAVAEAELWTADLRLVRQCRSLGLDWVHGLGG